jgi:hypothetical protein
MSSASWFISLIQAESCRRVSMASQVKRPCRKLPFAEPFGAPGELPPCIRHLPFGIAGERHGLPVLVLAPQRGDRCMGNRLCMGLSLMFIRDPSPGLDGTDDGLPARVDVHVLDSDLLLSLAAMPVQGLDEGHVGA